MTYLLKIYKTKNDKKHFITDLVETELFKLRFNRKYFNR